ncbi:hypothetical protein B566_EDAN002907 [Ephemera danica]|nr:hypothetical protein B566_EDAN002907 [Ephemera danica]
MSIGSVTAATAIFDADVDLWRRESLACGGGSCQGTIPWEDTSLSLSLRVFACPPTVAMSGQSSKVAWVRVDTQTILSIHHNVITQNPRISLSHNDHRSWYLHINNVHEADRGWYMCQINTDPMRSRVGYIQVVVPPSIVDRETSSDMVVREGTNVSMTCKAEGYPEPYFHDFSSPSSPHKHAHWQCEPKRFAAICDEGDVSVNVVDGELLHVTRVSRLHMGAYLCIAIPPMLSIPNQLEGAYMGQDVALECHTEAYPSSINYWTTERGDMIVSGDKYEAVSVDNSYKKYMMLKIRNVSKKDFGSYKCVAKNSLGETDGIIKLDVHNIILFT